jgi:cell division protein FtsN
VSQRSGRRSSNRRPSSSPRGGGHPFLWGLAAGVLLVVTAGYFLLPPPPPPGISAVRAEAPVQESGQKPAGENAPRYDFYTILHDMEVKVPDWQLDTEQHVEQKPDAITEPEVYVLQVGAFRSDHDAQRAKADLALKGIRAAVQEVTINGSERWFRVRVGPFGKVEELQAARAALIEQGVGFIVVKDRGTG